MKEHEIERLDQAIRFVGKCITPCVAGREDATGGYVESLTEAAMGMTTALCKIADAIHDLADATREANK